LARYSPLLALVVLTLLGCAEATLVRNAPSGARVYYRDRFVGVTPIRLVVPHHDLGVPLVVHVESDGYQSQDVNVPTTIGKGRIVGGILTLGIQLALQATYDLGRSSGSSTTGGDRGTHGRHGDQDGT